MRVTSARAIAPYRGRGGAGVAGVARIRRRDRRRAAHFGRVTIGPGRVLACVLVVTWSAAAVWVVARRPDEPLSLLMMAGAWAGAAAVLGAALVSRPSLGSGAHDGAAALRALGVALLPAIGLHLALGLPDGALRTSARRGVTVVGYAAALGLAAYLFNERPRVPIGPLAVIAGIAAVAGLVGYVGRCRNARNATERARLQWVAWAVVVAAAVTLVAVVLNALVSWPDAIRSIAVSTTLLVPVALAFGASEQLAVRIDRLLVHSITLTGLVGLVGASYLLIVLGLGRAPTGAEKTLLGLSMLAAAVAALLWVPARERLAELATRRVDGERHAPDEVLRTFGSRLTRALPLDELLLQLAESLKATMNLEVAEVWTRGDGGLERAVSVPDRGPAVIPLATEEETVVIAHAGVSGPAWAQVWLPALVQDLDEPVLRTAPITNSGELLGLIVVRRAGGALPFNEADDLALTELARQVGLALHNVKLDSALQESLDAVRRHADELRASRARIVEATDTERRRIERDLHDGAQQHLVALAVGVRLARQIADTDPEQAKTMLDQIGLDLQEAVQELRNLAHGIYPPLLMDRGLPDALRAAAGRAALAHRRSKPTASAATRSRSRPPCTSAASKRSRTRGSTRASDADAIVTRPRGRRRARVRGRRHRRGLRRSTSGAHHGHGFVNMSDRVGAFGGSVTVDSAPGQGTRISGRIPLDET